MPELYEHHGRGQPVELIAGFATDQQIRRALADPGLDRLPDGPAQALLLRLAAAVGPYTLEVELDLRRRPRHDRGPSDSAEWAVEHGGGARPALPGEGALMDAPPPGYGGQDA